MKTCETDWETRFEIPGRVTFMEGRGELPMMEVNTAWSTAEIYFHGAQVTHFKKKDEAPLLFLSQCSRFEKNQAIRGGVPIIFPWFGPREGMPSHGFARLKSWELKQIVPAPDGSVSVRFYLPETPEAASYPPFTADYIVTVKEDLTLELIVKNTSTDQEFTFENCLHSYFFVGDIGGVSVNGLKGVTYLDRVENYARKVEAAEGIKITGETDRTYQDTSGLVEILDRKLGRKICVEKDGSASTVVWNPWIAKAQQMPDLGNDEYQQMICVESGNVAANNLKLPPGKSVALTVKVSSVAL